MPSRSLPFVTSTLFALTLLGSLGCSKEGATSKAGASEPGSTAKIPELAPPEKLPVEVAKGHVQHAPTSHARIEAQGQLGPGRGTIIIDLAPGEGNKLTEGAPLRVHARGQDLTFPETVDRELKLDELPVRLPIEVADGAVGPVELDLTYYYCSGGDTGSCRPERARIDLVLDLSGEAEGGEAHFTHQPRM